ncbi:DUF11 domain-containing protein [Deinococcus sedimenti]|uniref:DUF11 domain-containing protein n=1 Tax=Deinococcus sedimenti TaxID=1867090 RepID=UPI00166F1E3B|nr:DUF11 domain-containing protein [Deinococcus sedimenti]
MALLLLWLWAPGAAAQTQYGPVNVVTRYDQSCAGFRYGGVLNCTAKEFTVSADLNTADGTPPFCVAGSTMMVDLTLSLTSSNTDRYDFGIFVGKGGNDPGNYYAPNLANPSTLCTTGVLPTPPPSGQPLIFNALADTCGDLKKTSSAVQLLTMRNVPVFCDGGTGQSVGVPYLIAWGQNEGDYSKVGGCTPDNVEAGAPSKCQSGVASVSVRVGTVQMPIQAGGYVELTKQTLPDGDPQTFTFTATAPNGTYLGYSYKAADGSYSSITPVAPSASGSTSTTVTLKDDQSVRVYMSVSSTVQTLSLTEAGTAGWENGADISCANVKGTVPITKVAPRTVTASLSTTNAAATCTFTNTKSAQVTLAKSLPARVNAADQFTVSASSATGSIVGPASATTSGTGTTASTTFLVTPYTAASPNTVTLTDTVASGNSASATHYTPSLTCTGSAGSSNGTLPTNLAASTGTVQPTPGSTLSCTFTNRLPTLTITKAVSATYLKYDRQTSGSFQPKPGTLTYTVTVANTDAVARTVQITDTLPAGLQNITVQDSSGTAVPLTTTAGATLTQPVAGSATTGTDIRWTAGDLNVGETRTYTVTATPSTLGSAPSPGLSAVQNVVTLSAANQVGTRSGSASTNVIFPVMTKSVQNLTQSTAAGTSTTALPGDRLRYCIEARNAGSVTLNTYTITDEFPANTTFETGSASLTVVPTAPGTVTSGATQVSGTVASLAPNDTATLCFNVKVK